MEQHEICIICHVGFNLARLRTSNEAASAAWSSWRGINLAEDGLDINAEQFSLDNLFVEHGKDDWEAVRIRGRGIKPGSSCDIAGCDEREMDHRCGSAQCTFPLGYNGHLISAEEMWPMTCIQMTNFAWRPLPDVDYDEKPVEERMRRDGLLRIGIGRY